MNSQRRTLMFLALAAVAFAFIASPAAAGTYQVFACDALHSNYANNAWTPSTTNPAYISVGNACGQTQPGGFNGLYIYDTLNASSNTPVGYEGTWTFSAPPGTSITRFSYFRDIGKEDDNGWRPYLRANLGGDFEGCTIPPGQFQCGGTGTGDRTFGPGITELKLGLRCDGDPPATQCLNGASLHYANAVIQRPAVTIADSAAPAVGGLSGSLAAGGWRRGSQALTFTASDESGIKQLRVLRDGATLLSDDRACDDTRPAPCATGSVSPAFPAIDTASWPDGTYSLRGQAIDAAANVGETAPVTVRVDNSAPPAPIGLQSDGGEGWSQASTRTVAWSLPSQGAGSPIASSRIDLCPAGGATGCSTSSGAATSADVQLPGEGAWDVHVSLVDEAGNNSPANQATSTIRYDATPPGAPAFTARRVSERVFDVGWGPTGVQAAPIAGHQWSLCPTGAGACQNGAGGAESSRRVTIPSAAMWNFAVRLTDAAGNTGPYGSVSLEGQSDPGAPPPGGGDGNPPNAPRRDAGLDARSASWVDSTLRVSGVVDAKVKTVDVQLSCKGVRTTREVYAKSGRWNAKLRSPKRCSTASSGRVLTEVDATSDTRSDKDAVRVAHKRRR